MKIQKEMIISTIVMLLMFIASHRSKSCFGWFYEVEIPEELK